MSSSAAEKEQALLKKRLEAQLKLPHNQTCADCPSRLPRWASTNLGVFICTNCSGIHRGLGVHISKVRSCALDKWTPELVMTMENIGNKRANEHWEHDVPAAVVRPREGDMRALDRWIRDKYELRQYAPRNCPPPDGKQTQPAAPVAAAAPPVPPPKPAAFAQPKAVAHSAAALKPAAAPPPAASAAPAFDLLGGMDAPAPAAAATWDAFAEPPKAADDWMADFVVAAAMAPAPAAVAWDAFASAPAIPAPPPPQHTSAAAMLDLFGAPPVVGGVAPSVAAPLDLAGQLAGMQVQGGTPALAPPMLPPKPGKPPSNQDLLSL